MGALCKISADYQCIAKLIMKMIVTIHITGEISLTRPEKILSRQYEVKPKPKPLAIE